MVDEVKYLVVGYIINKNGIRPYKEKLLAISKMPAPQNVIELRAFLGMVNFYAKFVRYLSDILYPLYNLLRKSVPWNWDHDCELVFKEAKALLVSTEVLTHL